MQFCNQILLSSHLFCLFLFQYLLILPSIYNLCIEATVTRSLRGCQLLSFIGRYQSGIPVVADAIERFDFSFLQIIDCDLLL